jgi:N-acylneuraminate cytidylyltransferase
MPERIVALIPARAGSKRIPGKNTRELAGHPLLAYAIAAAQEAGIFERIVVSTDSGVTRDLAIQYGAVAIARRAEHAQDYSPDLDWVEHAMTWEMYNESAEAFCILRPTSPFRRGEWIKAAWDCFRQYGRADSLRAMRPVSEHPGKMWRVERVTSSVPLLPFSGDRAPWHSMPTQELPPVFVQTAALEIAWTRVLPDSISGSVVLPWVCAKDDPMALDINTPEDWARAEQMAAEHPEWLPEVRR